MDEWREDGWPEWWRTRARGTVRAINLDEVKSYSSLKGLVRDVVHDEFGHRGEDDEIEFDDGVLKRMIRGAVGPLLRKAMVSAVGIEEDFGRVRIKLDSPIARALQERAQKYAVELAQEFIPDLATLRPEISLQEAMESIKSDVRKAFRNRLQERIKELATEYANAVPRDRLQPLVEEVMLESYPELRRLDALRRLSGDGGSGR